MIKKQNKETSQGNIVAGLIITVLLVAIFGFIAIKYINSTKTTDGQTTLDINRERTTDNNPKIIKENTSKNSANGISANCKLASRGDVIDVSTRNPLSLRLILPNYINYKIDSDENGQEWGITLTNTSIPNYEIKLCTGCQFISEIKECGMTNENCNVESINIGDFSFYQSTYKDTGVISSLTSSSQGVDILINFDNKKELTTGDIQTLEEILSCVSFPKRE